MECNKEEAVRARAIAEKRFNKKDIFGAKKLAMRAQGLYPELEGIQQMIATFDVYIASEKKLHGDSDWYAILNVHPSADDDTVRKNYRKLALLLHPDKNKTVGAEGAFKFISQAWSLLSDKGKRASFDLMRNSRISQQLSSSVPSASPATNGLNKFAKTSTTARGPKGSSKVPPSIPKPKQATFWTACYRCKMQYEYLRKYLNNNLLCPNCRKAFFAKETRPPRDRTVKSSTAQWGFSQQQQQQNSTRQSDSSETRNSGRNKVPTTSEDLGNFSGLGSVRQPNYVWNAFAGASCASTPARAAAMVQQAYETVKREREEAQAAKKREEALRRKANATKRASSGQQGLMKRKRSMDVVGTSNHDNESVNRGGIKGLDGTCRSKFDACTTVRPGSHNSKGGNEVSQLDIRYILIEKATKDIKRNLDRSTNSSKNKETEDNNAKRLLAEEKEKEDMVAECSHDASFSSSIEDDSLVEFKRLKLSKTSKAKFVDVPDPNFHVFDRDRSEDSFEEDQVWAAYDNNDGMPRLYAMIHKVISRVPFKLQISWLNGNLRSDLGVPNRVASEYVKACGEFRAGSRIEKADALECFSDKVKWRRAKDGMIQIFPRRGDVWALFRNWSPEWNELTTDEIISKYDLVEVLADLMDEGVTIIPLVKVAGFRNVFHRHLDLGQIRTVPKEEMSRFSHHVPSHILTDAESLSALKGCHELDPAAVPLELLQTFCDMNEEEIATLMEFTNHIWTDEVEKTNEADMVQPPVKDMHETIQLNLNEAQDVCVLDDLIEVIMEKGT